MVVLVVVLGFGAVAGVVVATGLGAVSEAPVAVGLDAAEVVPEVGVEAGAVGKVVIGVGRGGRGFDKMLAIISFRPASV